MSTQPNAKARLTDPYAPPNSLPDPPKIPDMQQHPHITEIDTVLRQHFAHRPDVLVSGEGYLCHTTRNRTNWLVPDCVVAFGVDPRAILLRNGYVISEVGKQPDLVLEVASKTTAETDYTKKRDGYANFGIAEFWRFDATGGERYGAALAGDFLVNGVYQPLELHHEPDGLIWGHSVILGLDLCWDDGRLRFYDPAAGQYLLNLAEAQARGDVADARADEAQARGDAADARVAEAQARGDAADARAAEAQARGDAANARAAEAQARRDAAKARAAEAEAELRLLREQLRRQQSE